MVNTQNSGDEPIHQYLGIVRFQERVSAVRKHKSISVGLQAVKLACNDVDLSPDRTFLQIRIDGLHMTYKFFARDSIAAKLKDVQQRLTTSGNTRQSFPSSGRRQRYEPFLAGKNMRGHGSLVARRRDSLLVQ